MIITPKKAVIALSILLLFTATHIQYQKHIADLKSERQEIVSEMQEKFTQQYKEKLREINTLEEKLEEVNQTARLKVGEAWEEARKKYGEPYDKHAEASEKTVLKHDGYVYKVVDNVKNDFLGVTYRENNTVRIETGLTAHKFDLICNHETLHAKFPRYEHSKFNAREDDSIYELDDDLDTEHCDKLTLAATK